MYHIYVVVSKRSTFLLTTLPPQTLPRSSKHSPVPRHLATPISPAHQVLPSCFPNGDTWYFSFCLFIKFSLNPIVKLIMFYHDFVCVYFLLSLYNYKLLKTRVRGSYLSYLDSETVSVQWVFNTLMTERSWDLLLSWVFYVLFDGILFLPPPAFPPSFLPLTDSGQLPYICSTM